MDEQNFIQVVGRDTHIHAMKVDVEGFLVLQSTIDLWRRGKIIHMVLELRPAQISMFHELYEANYLCGPYNDEVYSDFPSFESYEHSAHSADGTFVDCSCHLRGTEFPWTA